MRITIGDNEKTYEAARVEHLTFEHPTGNTGSLFIIRTADGEKVSLQITGDELAVMAAEGGLGSDSPMKPTDENLVARKAWLEHENFLVILADEETFGPLDGAMVAAVPDDLTEEQREDLYEGDDLSVPLHRLSIRELMMFAIEHGFFDKPASAVGDAESENE